MSLFDAGAQSLLDTFRADTGNTITRNGVTVPCTTANAQSDDLQYLPDGAQNAANADNRVFALSPTDGAQIAGSADEFETYDIVWNVNGTVYTVTRSSQSSFGSTWRLVTYRKPVVGTSAASSAAMTAFDP